MDVPVCVHVVCRVSRGLTFCRVGVRTRVRLPLFNQISMGLTSTISIRTRYVMRVRTIPTLASGYLQGFLLTMRRNRVHAALSVHVWGFVGVGVSNGVYVNRGSVFL